MKDSNQIPESIVGSAAGLCSRLSLPMDMRRLRSVASDIAKGWSEHVPEIEKRAMMWAIQEFHRWMVSENTTAQAVPCDIQQNNPNQ